jgi:hypothetical protein
MTMTEERPEFRVGPFSAGDIIALGGVAFASGALWFQVGMLQREQAQHEAASAVEKSRITDRVQALEQAIPSGYVRRDEYREDAKEIKAALGRIELELKTKADK